MRLVKQHQSKVFQNSQNCEVIEYSTNDADMNMAVIKLSGRYPEQGFVVNKECKEILYVQEGLVSLAVKGQLVQELQSSDMVLIDKNEPYFWEGNAILISACSPAWSPEQHEMVI